MTAHRDLDSLLAEIAAGEQARPGSNVASVATGKAEILSVSAPVEGQKSRSKPATLATLLHNATATDWQAFYDERAGILQYEGQHSRQEAERRALDETIQHWQALNPPPASEPQNGCIVCRDVGDDLLSYVARPKTHFWLHLRCRPVFDKARRDLALDALRQMIPCLPIAPRDALEELLDGAQ